MSEFRRHAGKLFDSLVGCLVASSDMSADYQHLFIMTVDHTLGYLCMQRILSTIAIISLNSLIFIKHFLECKTKYRNVRPVTTRKRSHHPNNPPCQNADRNLIPKARTIKLVRMECLPLSLHAWNQAISCVDGGQTVIANITLPPVLPIYLWQTQAAKKGVVVSDGDIMTWKFKTATIASARTYHI